MQQRTDPIVITAGGTYSGNWTSNDPDIPAVTIRTDDAVAIHDSTIRGRGTLISLIGTSAGANVTIENVTATALDPGIAGKPRGSFINSFSVHSLVVSNCTIKGVNFGVVVAGSTPMLLKITNNLATDLEDRASDGSGGLQTARPELGHFVLLNGVTAEDGAEIAWNKVIQTIGQSSVEDVINIYKSRGSANHPIWVHDNFVEGNSSPTTTDGYTGTGILTDGDKSMTVSAFVLIEHNDIVHTAGSGIAIANGHDITLSSNSVVSCGKDSSGNWFAMPFADAAVMWDYYRTGPSLFYNNSILGTSGGLVRPDPQNDPMASDMWAPDLPNPGNLATPNAFTDPCITTDGINLQAEDAARASWAQKAAAQNEVIGNQHDH